MKTENFQATQCRSCGKVIWEGICATGFDTKADVEKLTITDQIVATLAGRHIYRVIKTSVSFTLKLHDAISINYYRDPIVLASHICTTTHLFQTVADAPDYFPKKVATAPVSSHPIPEGFPF
jgi:hypothetical protein